MLLGYLDESYERGQTYWLCVGLIPAENVAHLVQEVEAVAHALEAFGLERDVELHGRELFHAMKRFSALKGPDGIQPRVAVFRGVFRALARARARILLRGVEWNDGEEERALDRHRMAAIQHLIPTLQETLEALDEHCVLIADEEETTRQDVLRAVRKHKSKVAADGREQRILDNVLFVESRDSRGVQALDLVAFFYRRFGSGADKTKPQVRREMEKWWEILRPAVLAPAKHASP